ncbi:MAG: N-acetylmuramoyl-L-alanine amidase [Oscillospiraceae bacterium]|nr:N-acetylmuramoyl-L-alanine amidase [Oscillospiraceae bacterium]
MKKHFIVLLLLISGRRCAGGEADNTDSKKEKDDRDEISYTESGEAGKSPEGEEAASANPDGDKSPVSVVLDGIVESLTASGSEAPAESTPAPEESPEPEPTPEPLFGEGYVIAIDAGHCSKPETWLYEPVGPGATETKMKDTGGTAGRFTGVAEYELNLQLALKLQALLEERGYTVYMTRTENEVSLGNIDRATVANDANADAFIRIHANGSEDSSVHGAMTLCQTPYNPYVQKYEESKLLSVCVLEELCNMTGAYQRSIWETDTMAGINWSQVPCTLVEVGFMTNREEDEKMATEEYRSLIAEGLANGIDRYILERAALTGAE